MDEKDFESAAAAELMERELGIDRAHKAARTHTRPPDFDGTCGQCGADVQPDRIAANYFLCVDCVAEQEHAKRLFAHS